jgi:hypothetical protein
MQEMREKEDGLGNGTSATHAAWFDVRFRALSDINAWPSACRRMTQSGHIRARPGNQMAGSSRGFLWNVALARPPPQGG